jgi:hypothetical protein
MFPDFEKIIALLKVPRLCPLSFWYNQHVDEDEHGALVEILGGENRSTWTKTCPCATFSTTNLTRIEAG